MINKILILSIFTLWGCGSENSKPVLPIASKPLSSKSKNHDFKPVTIGIGVAHIHSKDLKKVVFYSQNKDQIGLIDFENKKFQFRSDSMDLYSLDMFNHHPIDFYPFLFDGESRIFRFICIDTIGEYYKVITNSITNEVSLLDKRNKAIIFKDWNHYILLGSACFGDDFILYSKPTEDSKKTSYKRLKVLRVKKIIGEWAYVACDLNAVCEECDDASIKGWIKWRDKDLLLLDIRFDC